MFTRIKILAAIAAVASAATLIAVTGGGRAALAETATNGQIAPEFTGIDGWVNSKPLTTQQLRGSVVLVDFWTYSCINCIHTVPYVKDWYRKYGNQGFTVVGVHTPEYPFERDTGNLKTAIARLGIDYPVAQDNSYATWSAYGNQYWPAFYLIDRKGHVVYSHFGEGDYAQTEAAIQRALADKG